MNVTKVGESTHYTTKNIVVVDTKYDDIDIFDASKIVEIRDYGHITRLKYHFEECTITNRLTIVSFYPENEFVFSGGEKKINHVAVTSVWHEVNEDELTIRIKVDEHIDPYIKVYDCGRVKTLLSKIGKMKITYNL